jgi:uncharacterized membrane protein YkoI
MSKRIVRLSVVVLVILGITTGGIVWKSWASSPVLLSEEEVVQIVLGQYPGEVVSVSLENDAYVIQIELVKGLYELSVDADEGTINSIRRLEATVPNKIAPDKEPSDQLIPDREQPDKETPDIIIPDKELPMKESPMKESPVKVPIQEPEVVEPTKNPTKNPTLDVDKGSITLVTREKAAVLSRKQVPGTVHNIELRGKDISSYYLVKIITEDNREAVVQVNGISGAIMSVTWDDNSEDVKDVNDKNVKNNENNENREDNNGKLEMNNGDSRNGRDVKDNVKVIDKKGKDL